MPRNESPANTVMRDVDSGDDSGVYYLLISSVSAKLSAHMV